MDMNSKYENGEEDDISFVSFWPLRLDQQKQTINFCLHIHHGREDNVLLHP